MSYLKDEKRIELIFKRGFPYPWDFHLGSQSNYEGKNYEQYWKEKEEYQKNGTEEMKKKLLAMGCPKESLHLYLKGEIK